MSKNTTPEAGYMTTFVVRTNNPDGFDARASATMGYTHALVTSDGYAYSWHTSEANARKAANAAHIPTGTKVVAVEQHRGGKATIVKRLKAEAAAPAAELTDEQAIAQLREKGKKAGQAADAPKAAKAPKAAAKAADAPAAKRVPTEAVTEGSMKCRVCSTKKPVTSFPTKAKNTAGLVLRDDRCRACRAEARAAKKSA